MFKAVCVVAFVGKVYGKKLSSIYISIYVDIVNLFCKECIIIDISKYYSVVVNDDDYYCII